MESIDNKGLKVYLFPYYTKFIGFACIAWGIITGYLYFFGGKPSFFETKVFALVSAYLKTRYFLVIQTNLLDEMASVFLVAGLGFISFSKEKQEKEEYMALRFKALIWAVYSSIIMWILVFLLFYGYSIFVVSPLVFIGFFIFYNLFFRLYLKGL